MSDGIDLTPIVQTVSASTDAIKSAIPKTESITKAIDKQGTAVTTAINKLDGNTTAGVELIAEQEEKVNTRLTEISGLAAIVADVLQGVNGIYDIVADDEGTHVEEKGDEEPEEKPLIFDEDISATLSFNESATISDLGASTTMPQLLGTGFAVLASGLKSLQQSLLDGFADLTKVLLKSNAQEAIKDQTTGEPVEQKTGTNFKTFLEQLAGPLESVGKGLLLVTTAVTVLALLPLSVEVIIKTAATFGALALMLTTLQKVTLEFQKHKEVIDPEQQQSENSLIYQVNALSKTLLYITGAFLAITVVAGFLQDHLGVLAVGLVITLALVVTSLVALVGLEHLMKSNQDVVAEGGTIMTFMEAFSKLLLYVTGVFVVAGLLHNIVLQGIVPAIFIVSSTLALVYVTLQAAQQMEGSEEAVEKVVSVVKKLSIMLTLIGAFTVVFGLLDDAIILKGLTVTSTLLILTTVLISLTVLAASQVNEEALSKLTGFVVALSAMLAIETAMIIILGKTPPEVLEAGGITIALMFTALIIAMKFLQKIDIPDSVWKTILSLSAFTIAIAALAFVITTAMQTVTLGTVLAACGNLLVISTTLGVLGVGAVFVFDKVLGSVLTPAVVLKSLETIALIGIVALAIAGIAKLTIMLLGDIQAEQVNTAVLTILKVTGAFVVLGLGMVALAALSAFIGVTMAGALITIGVLVVGLLAIVGSLYLINAVPIDVITGAGEKIEAVTTSLASITTAIVSFMTTSLVLTLLVLPAAAQAAIIAVGLGTFAISVQLMSFELQRLASTTIPDVQNVSALTEALESVKDAIKAMDDFPTMPLAKQLQISATLHFLQSLPKKLTFKNADTVALDNLREFASAVRELSDAGSGLEGLAANLAKVVEEASKLSKDASIEVRSSAEAISNTKVQFENLTNMKLDRDSVQLQGADKIESKLDEMMSLMRDILKQSETTAAASEEQARVANILKNKPQAVFSSAS